MTSSVPLTSTILNVPVRAFPFAPTIGYASNIPPPGTVHTDPLGQSASVRVEVSLTSCPLYPPTTVGAGAVASNPGHRLIAAASPSTVPVSARS